MVNILKKCIAAKLIKYMIANGIFKFKNVFSNRSYFSF